MSNHKYKNSQPPKASQAVINHVPTSTCPTCGSSQRGAYYNCRFLEYHGTDQNGKSYSGVWLRYCKCDDCEQIRIDKSLEYIAER